MSYHAVVSDLHWGEGSKLEDFERDAELGQLLDHLCRQSQVHGAPSELIINGDFIDFLRVSPLEPGPWRAAIDKLKRVHAAHEDAFAALGRFVMTGNRVTIVAGNHDVELVFPEVQQALTALIVPDAAPDVRERVVFPRREPPPHFGGRDLGPFFHELRGVYIEHGNQLDPSNAFEHARILDEGAEGRLRLPLGSRFVYEISNDVESDDESNGKFLNKVKDAEMPVLAILAVLNNPGLCRRKLPGLLGLGDDFIRALGRRARMQASPPGVTRGASPEPAASGPEDALMDILAPHAEDIKVVMSYGRPLAILLPEQESARGPALPPLPLEKAVARLISGLIPDRSIEEVDSYADAAWRLARSRGADVCVLGHTHGARRVERDGVLYLNTGTWVGLLRLDRDALHGAKSLDDLLRSIRAQEPFKPVDLLTFAEIAYPNGRLESALKRWTSNGPAELP